MMRRVLVALGALLALLVLGVAALWFFGWRTPDVPPPALGGDYRGAELRYGGLPRHYAWYRPRTLRRPAPLVFVLHGSAADGDRMRRASGFAFDELADQAGFIPVYPDGYGRRWNDCRLTGDFESRRRGVNDVGFLRAVARDLGRTVPVDAERIYAFGLSNGGHMALRLALEAPDFVAGVAAVAASLPAPGNQGCRSTGRPVAVLLINGTGDPVSPYEGGEVSLLFGLERHGQVLSSEATADEFRRLAGQAGPPFEHRYPDSDPRDGTVATRRVWAVPGRPEVGLITVHGGGHTIPHPQKSFPRLFGRTSHDLPAAAEAWRFFERQRPAHPPR